MPASETDLVALVAEGRRLADASRLRRADFAEDNFPALLDAAEEAIRLRAREERLREDLATTIDHQLPAELREEFGITGDRDPVSNVLCLCDALRDERARVERMQAVLLELRDDESLLMAARMRANAAWAGLVDRPLTEAERAHALTLRSPKED